MEEDWITTDEVVALTGYHPEYVRRLVRNEKLVAKKFGRTWQISRRSVDNYVEQGKASQDRRRGSQPSQNTDS